MQKVLILFAHPRLEKSIANAALLKGIPRHNAITFHDLYESYPDFNVDIKFEKSLLLSHDVIIWHHPFYWYSAPPLLKQWIDLVLEYGWAYGKGGDKLQDKVIFNVLTSGGKKEIYHAEGRNRFTVREFLRPFEQTAKLCHMTYLPPFVVHGTHSLGHSGLNELTTAYRFLLEALLQERVPKNELDQYEYLNDWLNTQKTDQT